MPRARRLPDGDDGRAEAIDVLRAGGIVALPTDTVYGLAVDLAAQGAIERLFEAKDRPRDRAIAVLLADADQAAEIGIMTPPGHALAGALWPGALTLVLEARRDLDLPRDLTAGRTTIGLRVPDHPAPRALAAAIGPLPTTSANRSGEPEARDADEIEARLGGAIALILDGGPSRGGPPSTVIDASVEPVRVLRAGAVDPRRIAEILAAAGLSPFSDMGR